jgi:hypothetical protein
MRKYQPIWQALKDHNTCTVSAPKHLHRRIIKAVIKEKDMDTLYKFQHAEDFRKKVIEKEIDGSTIKFKLVVAVPGLGDI